MEELEKTRETIYDNFGEWIKTGFNSMKRATDDLIDCYKDKADEKDEEIEILREEMLSCSKADGKVLIGNYEELKRVLILNNVWNEELEYVMENIVRFNNVMGC